MDDSVLHPPTDINEWRESDDYHNAFLLRRDPVLEKAVRNSRAKGLRDVAVSAAQGKFLHLLAQSIQAKRIIELGTLGGFSTTWLARALPEDGKLYTFEVDPQVAKVAEENIRNAGQSHKVQIVVGRAIEELPKIPATEPFDFIFIDADKPSYPSYYKEAKRLVRKGGVIVSFLKNTHMSFSVQATGPDSQSLVIIGLNRAIVDNVVRAGPARRNVSDPKSNDPNIEGVRELLQIIKNDPEVEATTIGTVGDKGYDGFLYAVRHYPAMAFTQEHAENWKRSDAYFNSFLLKEDPILDATLQNSRNQGLDNIAVSAAQGKLLHLLAKSMQAKRIVEVGLLGGYSTIWLARALPDDGKLITFEIDSHSVKVAGENLNNAGLADKVEIVLGPAAEELPKLKADEPFDLIFIDADKPSNPIYFKEAKRLVRKGGVIIVDNVVRRGKVADPQYQDDPNLQGVRDLVHLIKDDPEVEATTIATVGEKGYDGFLYAVRQ
ncbi:hypothetical protein CVT24_009166 [Panaeolus cyanescens]|uniref:O-methyltransferase domain-containing protein n=1 Tax=Panaeolus cyanescens TaxID=181874 RepID=A0A409Y8M5_9AGAR|nr:hypothetical protein CVT24_009166 [Panaeolus cyanescens]